MTSVDVSSTNDISSTARSSTSDVASLATVGGAVHDVGLHAPADTLVLTTDAIVKECIRQGFYRNPICNEKLYLHNKGYGAIAPTAFELYTDVKVLWLEGNAFRELPCGASYTQVAAPKNKSALYSSSSSSTSSSESEAEPLHVPLSEDGGDVRSGQDERHSASSTPLAVTRAHHADPSVGVTAPPTLPTQRAKKARPPLPAAADVPVEERDVFSSLYPTVRQLYLHNNLLREMPDLSRFERLEAVNLANNFFSAVSAHCEGWCEHAKGSAADEEDEDSMAAAPDSDEVEVVAAPASAAADATLHGDGSTTGTAVTGELVLSSVEATRQRGALLEDYQRQVHAALHLCKHPQQPARQTDAPACVAPSHRRPADAKPRRVYRNLCSSLRSLNLAGNHAESFTDLLPLLCFRNLSVLDLSQNRIRDGEALLLILEQLKELRSLKLSGNPLVRSLPKYRKVVLSRCTNLCYLDDRPVFPDERRLVTAWATGGAEGEAREREAVKREEQLAIRKRIDDFRNLLAAHRHSSGEKRDGAVDVGPLDSSHQPYVHAIMGGDREDNGNDGLARQNSAESSERRVSDRAVRPRPERAPNSDPDASPTSDDEEDEEYVRHDDAHPEKERESLRASAATTTTPPRAAGVAAHYPARVLSSNGPSRKGCGAAAVSSAPAPGVENSINDDDTMDVFIPS